MEYFAALPLGLLIGMAHAFEADHLAAVMALQNRQDTTRSLVRRGAVWGLGHTLSLFVVCVSLFLLGLTVSGRLEALLELLVGFMIAGLGLHVLWRLRRDRIHLHAHEHNGDRHIHLHRHGSKSISHKRSPHRHGHVSGSVAGTGKILAIGVMHGLAGSAAFLVLLTASADNIWQVLAYLAVFGAGSIFGMAALSAVISLPLGLVQRLSGWVPATTTGAIGLVAILVGGTLAVESLRLLAGAGA